MGPHSVSVRMGDDEVSTDRIRKQSDRPRVLIVDDELAITKFVRANLKAEGFETIVSLSGAAALEAVELELPDLVVLDINLPDIDGFEVCNRLRGWSSVPIIMLSARVGEEDKIKCLDMGADDYITKPFSAHELVARIRAVLRRAQSSDETTDTPVFDDGCLRVNFAGHEATLNGTPIKMTPTEFLLLRELVGNAGKVITHQQLLHRVWGVEYGQESEYLYVYMGRLRRKIEVDPENPNYIHTVPCLGYQFNAHVACAR